MIYQEFVGAWSDGNKLCSIFCRPFGGEEDQSVVSLYSIEKDELTKLWDMTSETIFSDSAPMWLWGGNYIALFYPVGMRIFKTDTAELVKFINASVSAEYDSFWTPSISLWSNMSCGVIEYVKVDEENINNAIFHTIERIENPTKEPVFRHKQREMEYDNGVYISSPRAENGMLLVLNEETERIYFRFWTASYHFDTKWRRIMEMGWGLDKINDIVDVVGLREIPRENFEVSSSPSGNMISCIVFRKQKTSSTNIVTVLVIDIENGILEFQNTGVYHNFERNPFFDTIGWIKPDTVVFFIHNHRIVIWNKRIMLNMEHKGFFPTYMSVTSCLKGCKNILCYNDFHNVEVCKLINDDGNPILSFFPAGISEKIMFLRIKWITCDS